MREGDACASQSGARARAGGTRSGVDGLLLVDLLDVRLHGFLLGQACAAEHRRDRVSRTGMMHVRAEQQAEDAPFLSAQALHLALPVRSNMPGLAVSLSPTVACLYSAYSASFSSLVCADMGHHQQFVSLSRSSPATPPRLRAHVGLGEGLGRGGGGFELGLEVRHGDWLGGSGEKRSA